MPQIDSSHLRWKLTLRRAYLTKYGCRNVIDCCQGQGVIWKILRKEFDVQYVGFDRKSRTGKAQVDDSARVLSIPGHTWDVIDIDTYGAPWKHLYAAAKTITIPTTIFLTVGRKGSIYSLPIEERKALALNFSKPVPVPLQVRLHERAMRLILSQLPSKFRLEIIECSMVEYYMRETTYIALRVEPRRT